ncbi:hypothetical protein PAECIP111893_01449 [Paenibacillus plantiphilus]|uniref:Glycoside hydrolase family 42 N-terminal domain-containing protein n=1 Tax=Paenibacillus plantiphilus TaxID=2905650 RepID=A0ABM9C3N4_9BACL|nr:alpha-amylase family protein [Paenibacillus plantiphilus]CAH1200561.1 hypothetical protein PAECIP111893_01449 [Paenibacillus plantiphilus]
MSGYIVFYDSSFPVAGNKETIDSLAAALREQGGLPGEPGVGNRLIAADASQLAEVLETIAADCLINLHAPYFPKAAWPAILAFLRGGGGLISLGGAPFKHPVRHSDDGAWHIEAEQTAYHQQLHIHEALRVDSGPVASLLASSDIPLFAGAEALFEVADTWNLVPHVTKSSDLPHQMGSSGPMDTRIYPLLKGISTDSREVAAPAVLWENNGGPFAGSRWLFINQPLTASFLAGGGAEALAQWAAFCAKGITELWLKTSYASYLPGEKAILTLQLQRISGRKRRAAQSWRFAVSLVSENGNDKRASNESSSSSFSSRNSTKGGQIWTTSFEAVVGGELQVERMVIPLELDKGQYRVECRAEAADGEVRLLHQGFWCFDERLLAEGSPVACGRDYFVKDGRPLPVVGMTYMTSDTSRKFLFLPNVSVWDRDMAQMHRSGINWIRTGIWTAYRNIMQVDGHASEEVLRSIDAFLLTASKYGFQVTFTFFSFTPETWEGVNPYLDPRSVEAQKRFIRLIVSRYRNAANIDWDLINEPSMFDPKRIFSDGPRSCGDPFERAAYVKWLRKRHGSIDVLQERWNMSPEQLKDFETAALPEPEEINFDVQDMHQAKRGTRWLDYVLFSMDMHNRWAAELYGTIKQLCPDHLVTVGQDEALGAQRPSPFFYAEAVDYTTVHSWWLNDQLVWDGVFAKTPDKPNLVQETGIMYVETPDGRAKRSEAELRNILERKYAYAFATGGAGAVQWIWNTNFYMDNANESHIGALRADGTEKPEAEVSRDFGRFMDEIRDLFHDRVLEETAVIFPYSNDFSNRKLAFDATTKAVRVLAYELNQPFRAVGEYHLDALESSPAKLIILPSAHNIDDAAFERLLDIVRKTGAVLLVTGPASLDAYWRPNGRLAELLGPRELANVLREEQLIVDGRTLPVSFGARRIAEVFKEVGSNGSHSIVDVPLGAGLLLWCPLPVELNERSETIAALYRYAASAAKCSSEMEWISGGELLGIYGNKLTFAGGSLYVFVSEFARDAEIAIKDSRTNKMYSFKLASERSVLFATDAEGCIASVYRPDEVRVVCV